MNVVDSSGWLEFFAGGRQARHFQGPIVATDDLLVPVICVYEVFKVICQQRNENDAIQAVADMKQGKIVDITDRLALSAGQISLSHHLPMADSLILAVTRQFDATLWTQDADFEGLDKVRYFKK